jgi:hypothetical protein
MTKENIKSVLVGVPFLILLFGGSYLWRQNKAKDISNNSKYSIGIIIKKTGSLTSGVQWHYEFKYDGHVYSGYRSTHVDYDVAQGDYFLVNFSSKHPDHNKILYDYKVNKERLNFVDSVWDTIPTAIVHSGLKK